VDTNIGRELIELIELLSLEVFDESRKVAELRRESAEIADFHTVDVATNPAFKNELARKAEVKATLAQHPRYNELQQLITEGERLTAMRSARLERNRNEFALYKLEFRAHIAAMYGKELE